jgi:aspartate racemase
VKLIGLLGGMSWESTAEYYRLANEIVRDRVGGLSSARVLLHSVDFSEIERMQAEGDWEAAGQLLTEAARGLERGGAELLVLCTNTMHKVADQITASTTVPLLHIGDVTAAAIRASGLRRVGLLATAYTMEQPFMRDRLASHGLSVIVPEAADRAVVHRVIYEELCLGIVTDASRDLYRGIIARLVDRGAEGVILGCTEIELLIHQADSPVPVFPTTRLHVEAAIAAAFDASV